MRRSEYIGVILCGGSNRRFPYPKGLIRSHQGQPLVEQNAILLGQFFGSVLLSTNTPEIYFHLGLPMVGDIYPSRGPLSGIFSALVASDAKGVFVLACDMPSVRKSIIKLILQYQHKAHAVVCRAGGKVHPLVGLYRRELLPLIENLLQQGPVRLIDFVHRAAGFVIAEQEVLQADPEAASFININTPEDLQRYLTRAIH